jgi:hypothetical protein
MSPRTIRNVAIKWRPLGPWIIEADGESHGAARSTLAVRSTIAHVSGTVARGRRQQNVCTGSEAQVDLA